MRVTRKQCENMIERMNKQLGRPTEHWTEQDGKVVGNIGHIGLDITSPGDGVTRYHVYEVSSVTGGENNLRNLACLGTSELYEFLCGIEVGLRLAGKDVIL